MFDELLETRGRREQRSVGGTIASVVIHSALIVGTVVATAGGSTPPPAVRDPHLIFVATAHPEHPPSPAVRRPTGLSSAPVFCVCATIELPSPPDFDPPLGAPIEPGTVGTPGSGQPGAPVIGNSSSVPDGGGLWTEAIVEKPAFALPGSPVPVYPELLRRAGVVGEVVAQFVVDTSGRVEPGSFRPQRETHPLFAAAVARVLPRMRFVAAEVGGHHVRQLVQQSFVFAIER